MIMNYVGRENEKQLVGKVFRVELRGSNP